MIDYFKFCSVRVRQLNGWNQNFEGLEPKATELKLWL